MMFGSPVRWAVGLAALGASLFTTPRAQTADAECAAPGVTNELTVISSSDAAALKTLLDSCEGGLFDVTWHGRVAVDDAFTVVNGTSLNITGVDGSSSSSQTISRSEGYADDDSSRTAAIEGSPLNRLFYVYGMLTLDNMVLEAYEMASWIDAPQIGGAIYAYTFDYETSETFEPPSPATVSIIDCTFRNYTASYKGKLELERMYQNFSENTLVECMYSHIAKRARWRSAS